MGSYARQEKSYYGRNPFRARPLTHGRDPSRTGETPHGRDPHGRDPSRVTPLPGLMGNNFLPCRLATLDGRAYVKADRLGFELRVRLGDGCEGGAPGELCTLDCDLLERAPRGPREVVGGVGANWYSGGRRGPKGAPRGGGEGVPQPAAGADFFGMFSFFTRFFTCFHGNSAYLRPCYHALRHPFGAADRAMLLN